MTDNTQTSTLEDDDFLPDLCGPQPVLALILVSELFVAAMILAAYGLAQFDWARFGMVSILTQWVVLTSAGCLCLARPLLKRLHPVAAGLSSYGLALSCTLVFSLFLHWINTGSMQGAIDSLIGNLAVAAVLAGIVLRYLYLQQQLRNQQKAELQSRLQALQSRIRPHFLFNSMNTIASLIAVDQDTAERVVVELSHLFRASLGEPGLIPLRNEVDLCRYYVDIEQMRIGERLRVEWCYYDDNGAALAPDDERFKRVTIPSFSLQPLVENAIYHGIQPLPEGGTIHIDLRLGAKHVEVILRNPVQNQEDKTVALDKTQGNGIALENIRHRLHAYYGNGGTLKALSHDGEFVVALRYPRLR